jgi:hypothetical protein
MPIFDTHLKTAKVAGGGAKKPQIATKNKIDWLPTKCQAGNLE